MSHNYLEQVYLNGEHVEHCLEATFIPTKSAQEDKIGVVSVAAKDPAGKFIAVDGMIMTNTIYGVLEFK